MPVIILRWRIRQLFINDYTMLKGDLFIGNQAVTKQWDNHIENTAKIW